MQVPGYPENLKGQTGGPQRCPHFEPQGVTILNVTLHFQESNLGKPGRQCPGKQGTRRPGRPGADRLLRPVEGAPAPGFSTVVSTPTPTPPSPLSYSSRAHWTPDTIPAPKVPELDPESTRDF